jgi:hypothetical protein
MVSRGLSIGSGVKADFKISLHVYLSVLPVLNSVHGPM